MMIKKKFAKLIKSESGFTLIELLVVIGIIAILATIGAINFGSARGKARDAKRISDLKQISAAIEVEAAGVAAGTYPIMSDLPPEVTELEPPDPANEAYCYFVNTNDSTVVPNTFYVVAAVGIEDTDNANGGYDLAVVPAAAGPLADWNGVAISGDEALCPGTFAAGGGALTVELDCNPGTDNVYCIDGSTAT